MLEYLGLHSGCNLVDDLEGTKQKGLCGKERSACSLLEQIKFQAFSWAKGRT